jgi:hypothetical protein
VGMPRNSTKDQDSHAEGRKDQKYAVEVTSFVRGCSRLCSRENRGNGALHYAAAMALPYPDGPVARRRVDNQ